MVDTVERIVIPDLPAIKAEMGEFLSLGCGLDSSEVAQVYALATRMRFCAKRREELGEEWAKKEIAECDDCLREILCKTALGVRAPYPEDFWSSSLGKLMYYIYEMAFGADLLTQKQVAERLGYKGKWAVSRVAQHQRYGDLDYVMDPQVQAPNRSRRRVSSEMLLRFVARQQAEPEGDE